jgi:SNF2 family DNA or RNA helicase
MTGLSACAHHLCTLSLSHPSASSELPRPHSLSPPRSTSALCLSLTPQPAQSSLAPTHSHPLARRPQATEEAEPTKDLLMPLLPFQKQFLGWALKQEAGPLRGGILADEMGMGALRPRRRLG